MEIQGYTVPPVVACLLFASCIKTNEPPCLKLGLRQNQLEISASSLDSICEETAYPKKENGTIEVLTQKYDHKPTKLIIGYIILIVDQNPVRRINSDSYEVHTRLNLSLESGFHELDVIACNENNVCGMRMLPVYSYGDEIVLATNIANDLEPPRISGDFYSAKKVMCRACQANDTIGISKLRFEQDGNVLGDYSFNGFRQIVDYSTIIRNLQIDPEVSLEIIASDNNGNKTQLDISFDGYTASSIGGF